MGILLPGVPLECGSIVKKKKKKIVLCLNPTHTSHIFANSIVLIVSWPTLFKTQPSHFSTKDQLELSFKGNDFLTNLLRGVDFSNAIYIFWAKPNTFTK